MDRDTPIVVPEYISAYLEFPEQLGLKRAELSRKSGVDLDALAENPRPFTLNEILKLVEVGIKELQMPYGGLAIGQQMRLTCHGMAGVSAMAQQTYAECLQAACRLCEKAFPPFSMLLLNAGAELFLGIKMGKEATKVNESFIAAVDASLAVLRLPIPGTTWYRGIQGRRFLEQFIGSLVAEKRRSQDNDFFTQICHSRGENNEELTDQEVIDHMIFLLFAAHDTTTSTLCSLVYRLAKHPEWQETLREEILSLGTDEVTYDDLEKLEKNGLVFRETLRMHPPLPTIPRRAINDCEFQGFKIPKNAAVGVVPLHTHYMEEYWTNPYKFDPERFNPERAEHKKHFYQWVPFGGGHHKCLGLNFAEIQSKVFLFQLLRNYKVEIRSGYEMPSQIVPLAVPKDGFPCTLIPLK